MRELIDKINEIKKAMNDITKLNKTTLEKILDLVLNIYKNDTLEDQIKKI